MTHVRVTPGTGGGRAVRPGDLLVALARAQRTLGLYGPGHPVTARTLEETFAVVEALAAGRPALRLVIHEDTFFLGRQLLLEESLRLSGLLADLQERQIGLVEFHAGVEPNEVRRLVEILAMRPAELQRAGGAAAALLAAQVRHITVASPRPMQARERDEYRVEPRDVYRAGLRVVDDLYYQASRDLPLDLRKSSMVVSSLLDAMTQDRAGLLGVAALRLYDEATAHHAVNVAVLSLLVGLHLRLDRPLLNTLGLAALLHDVGKVRLPREIVTTSEPLTGDAQEALRRHPLYGALLLRNLPGLSRLAMVVAFEHHANYNLSGYPSLTARDHPHPVTRVVALADFYDAATASADPRARPLLPHDAMRLILDQAGRAFDPALARVFVQVLGLYPVGSLVTLESGESALVVRPGEREAERPVVRIVRAAGGASVDPYDVALENAPEHRIAGALDPREAGVDVTAYL